MKPAPNCPSCRVPMDVHTFSHHGGGPLELDICYACQGIWFDTHENQQLSPASVTDLFKQLHEHRDVQRNPVAPVMACPRCSSKLEHGYDIVRSGRYATSRCPHRHGRFSTFASFMIEKGFVRQLTKPEIHDLSKRVGAIYCTGCGAPVDIRKDHACPHCRSAFSLIDPDAVKSALNGYLAAEEKLARRDPDAIADALIDTERREQQARRAGGTAARSSRANPALDATSLDVGDLVMAGVALVWKILT